MRLRRSRHLGPAGASDEPTSSAAASPAALSASPRGTLVIHGTGDVNLDPSYIPALTARGYGHAWSGLDGLFPDDDLTVINLECPVCGLGAPVLKEFNFRCDPAAAAGRPAAGVEVANLANNHSGDFGPEATARLRHAGPAQASRPGRGRGERRRRRHARARRGRRLADRRLGFGGVVPDGHWLATETDPGMPTATTSPSMVAAVQAAAAGRPDVRDAALGRRARHAAPAGGRRPRRGDDRRRGGRIFGHHSHRLQPLGSYARPADRLEPGQLRVAGVLAGRVRTAVAEFVVEPDGAVTGCLLPGPITSPGHPELVGARSCAA